jgi:hypothetical protein
MEQQRPLSNPREKKVIKTPKDMQEYMLMRLYDVVGEEH